MKIASTIAGLALLAIGIVWTGQGANLIGGSFMTGQTTWLVIGIICTLISVLLLIWAARRRRFD